jgi:hypothetical protein
MIEQIRQAVRGFTGLFLILIGGSVAYSLYEWATIDHLSAQFFMSRVIKGNTTSDFLALAVSIIGFILSAPKSTPSNAQNREEMVAAAPAPPPPPPVKIEPPEDPEIVRARKLAEIELAKAEQMARLRLAEAQGLAGIASDVAEKEEARQDRQLDKLTKI